ncbi:MAG: UTP--glucose-1-phosphate uridylyltransferase [Proteobacteria bacterium]|nr:UTP--glucose-1-phosphate uridylyltransferase [Pseudomonadota bacterium]
MAPQVKKAVIPAGGLGTRFLPVTKSVPKELLPIGTKPTLLIVLEEAVASGIEQVILITSPQKTHIMDFFDTDSEYVRELAARGKAPLLEKLNELLSNVEVVPVQQIKPRGLGDAVLCSRDVVGEEPFVVILPDVLIDSTTPCCRQLIDAYAKTGCSLSATEHTPRNQIHLYGIYDIGKSDGRIHWAKGVVEKPSADEAPSDLSVVGRYCFSPEVYDLLENAKPGRGGEIQLADAQNELAKKGRFVAYEYEGRQFDTGDPLGFLKANIFYSWSSAPDEITSFMREMIGAK